MLDSCEVAAIVVSDPVDNVSIFTDVRVRVGKGNLGVGHCAIVVGVVDPAVTVFGDLVEALFVFLLRVCVPIRRTTEWSLAISN
ncbi:hypothetical protein AU188_07195 [Mycobacterium sp. IS-3022]|nr:hypothetical protein AU188_07195 [Mycobacterium sp. IS-3022]